MRTANPALNKNSFSKFEGMNYSDKMTINGTVNKTIFMLLILVAIASYFWVNALNFINNGYFYIILWGSIIGGLIFSLITIFKKEWSPVTAPIYSGLEGIALGMISYFFEMMFPNIVFQAVILTFGTLFVLLLMYKSRLIKVTENFKLIIVSATGGIALIYFVNIILRIFGIDIPFIHENGIVGIGFSLFVVSIAALNLVLDFDFIENAAKNNVPKYMEWYGAFGLIVTLVWLYLEILRLLAKLRSRK